MNLERREGRGDRSHDGISRLGVEFEGISLSFWVRASTQNYFNVVTKNDSFYSPRAKSESRIVFSIRENILMYMLSISIRVLLQHKS